MRSIRGWSCRRRRGRGHASRACAYTRCAGWLRCWAAWAGMLCLCTSGVHVCVFMHLVLWAGWLAGWLLLHPSLPPHSSPLLHARCSPPPHPRLTSAHPPTHLFPCCHCQVGPRLELEIVKVEEGLCDGRVLFHKYQQRSKAEADAQQQEWDEREALRAERRQQQVRVCVCMFVFVHADTQQEEWDEREALAGGREGRWQQQVRTSAVWCAYF